MDNVNEIYLSPRHHLYLDTVDHYYHRFVHLSEKPPDVPEYITAPVRKGDIENSVLATGRIDAIERVNVGHRYQGN